MNNIKSCFDQYNLLSRLTWDELHLILKERNLKKNESLCNEGGTYRNEVLVLNGVIRGFYQSYENEEVNVSFFMDSNFITPWMYRNINNISSINLQALVNTKIIEFDAAIFSELMQKHSDLMKFGRLIVERELRDKVDREINLLSKSGTEKYACFQKKYPGLENRIAHYHIASYLGITPISLSRLRGQK